MNFNKMNNTHSKTFVKEKYHRDEKFFARKKGKKL